ncbi:uncharacterized protein LOC112503099 [Cynara cardunculus var. scolymus]|uniref:uncharacterized protein LOC112503099 n=1 Tax=Cynara cardunculus var. scolymus TaxID=59895 RepID=UPI000D62B57F|nr:uncharacterized protein LOC112503099 [Cynara cardunculus var. scolymus]
MDCTLNLTSRDFRIDLIPIPLGSFDIIVGMDWLSKNRAELSCIEKIIRISLPEGGILKVHGEKPRRGIKIVTCLKMRKYLRKDCIAFLAHVMDKKAEEKRVQDILIIRELPEVFPDELPGIPTPRQVEFHIELIPGAAPVAKGPYPLAPSEMKELSEQLQELLNKGFIRPNSSPWDLQFCLSKRRMDLFECVSIIEKSTS